jgi:hypothetical protein
MFARQGRGELDHRCRHVHCRIPALLPHWNPARGRPQDRLRRRRWQGHQPSAGDAAVLRPYAQVPVSRAVHVVPLLVPYHDAKLLVAGTAPSPSPAGIHVASTGMLQIAFRPGLISLGSFNVC